MKSYSKYTYTHCRVLKRSLYVTRMATFIKTKLKKLNDQTNIDKYRVAANITEDHIISKLIYLRIIFPKLMMIRELFYVKIVHVKQVDTL